jgi:hypothetical protein
MILQSGFICSQELNDNEKIKKVCNEAFYYRSINLFCHLVPLLLIKRKNKMFKSKLSLLIITLIVFIPLLVCNYIGGIYVTGNITVDGKPVEGIRVTFVPVSGNRVIGKGITDSSGNYVLTISGTKYDSGIVPGQYTPIFNKTVYLYRASKTPPDNKPPIPGALFYGDDYINPPTIELILLY